MGIAINWPQREKIRLLFWLGPKCLWEKKWHDVGEMKMIVCSFHSDTVLNFLIRPQAASSRGDFNPDIFPVQKVSFCELIGRLKVSLVVDWSLCLCLPYVGVRSWQDGRCYGWLDWQTFLTAMTVSPPLSISPSTSPSSSSSFTFPEHTAPRTPSCHILWFAFSYFSLFGSLVHNSSPHAVLFLFS